MSKLQTYISERKKSFRDKFKPILESSGLNETYPYVESFNDETIEGCLAIVRKELLKSGQVFDKKVYAIPYARNKFEEIVLQALNTKK